MRPVRGFVSTNLTKTKSALLMPFIDLSGGVGEFEQPQQ